MAPRLIESVYKTIRKNQGRATCLECNQPYLLKCLALSLILARNTLCVLLQWTFWKVEKTEPIQKNPTYKKLDFSKSA